MHFEHTTSYVCKFEWSNRSSIATPPPPRQTKQKGTPKRWTTGGGIWKITKASDTDTTTSTHVSPTVPQHQPCREPLHVRHLVPQNFTGRLQDTSAYRSARVATSTAICFVYGVSWRIPQCKFAITRGNGPPSGWWVDICEVCVNLVCVVLLLVVDGAQIGAGKCRVRN